MGAADVVPGVSGGTVALVLGIYERLIDNIREAAAIAGHLLQRDPASARRSLRRVEWGWVLALLSGIGIAVLSLAAAIESLLEEQPLRMSALFFGLIAGSVLVAVRLIRRFDAEAAVVLIAAAVVTFVVLGLRGDTHTDGAEIVTKPLWAFLLAGAFAICAMILPGVSGSFLLVMVGMYSEVLGAVNDREIPQLLLFLLGCVVGLAAFSSLLSWALHHHHDRVIAAMVGLMVGSLRVLWPWPNGTDSTRLEAPTGDVGIPVLLALAGFFAVLAVEMIGTRRSSAVEVPSPA
jgi:putative membrane protein